MSSLLQELQDAPSSPITLGCSSDLLRSGAPNWTRPFLMLSAVWLFPRGFGCEMSKAMKWRKKNAGRLSDCQSIPLTHMRKTKRNGNFIQSETEPFAFYLVWNELWETTRPRWSSRKGCFHQRGLSAESTASPILISSFLSPPCHPYAEDTWIVQTHREPLAISPWSEVLQALLVSMIPHSFSPHFLSANSVKHHSKYRVSGITVSAKWVATHQ